MISLETLAIMMIPAMLVLVMVGCPVFAAVGGVAVIFGFLGGGLTLLSLFPDRCYTLMTSFPFEAVGLFIFMGAILERSGVADRLYSGFHLLMGSLRGGLLVATMILCVLFAACTGVSAASVVAIGLIALPSMMARGYDKQLASGTICAGGGLGVIIPPSIMLVLYGPTAAVSVAKLFMAAIIPGLILGGIYLLYIIIRCARNPKLGPPLPPEERKISKRRLLATLSVSLFPTLALILAVLGSIFFGIASPTEAAAVGVIGSLVICAAYRRLNWKSARSFIEFTIRTTAMVLVIALCAGFFTTVFLGIGGGTMIENWVRGLHLSAHGVTFLLLGIIFILGMFMDWVGILLIFLPLSVPIVAGYNIDPLWFAILFCITLQISYVTPPFSYSVFYLRGIAPPEVTLGDIYKGVMPFIPLQLIGLAIFYLFPQTCLWLPALMK